LIALLSTVIGCFVGCFSKKEPVSVHRGVAMTIPFTVIVNSSSSLPPVDNIINDTFFLIDHIYNKWNSNSEVSALNKATGCFQCSKELYALLQHCETFVSLSEGRFDPTIERLEQVWKTSLNCGITPDNESLKAVSTKIGWNLLEFDESGLVHKIHPEVQVDLGGIAKGYAVDLLITNIKKNGYTNIFVEWGGEVRTVGGHPEGRPWRVGIKNPASPEEVLTVINLFNGSVATSGDYQQCWIADDKGVIKQFFHVFSKETLAPIETTEQSLASVTIQHESCMVADAIASILLAIGNRAGAQKFFDEKILPHFPTASCYLVSHDDLSIGLTERNSCGESHTISN
jgi:FAD:protein FMN transferase